MSRRYASARSSARVARNDLPALVTAPHSGIFVDRRAHCEVRTVFQSTHHRGDVMHRHHRCFQATSDVLRRRVRRVSSRTARFAGNVSRPSRYFKIYNSSFQVSCHVKLIVARCHVSRTPGLILGDTNVKYIYSLRGGAGRTGHSVQKREISL